MCSTGYAAAHGVCTATHCTCTKTPAGLTMTHQNMSLHLSQSLLFAEPPP